MTFSEAVKVYAEAASRDSRRDRSVVRAINHDMGLTVCGVLMGHHAVIEACGDDAPAQEAALLAIRDVFVRAVENSITPTPLPMGVTEHLHRPELRAEIREDGHTYIGDERID